MNIQPKVSVIIPVYNSEPYLKQCLDSVLNQSMKELEVICVDDGSTDASTRILREYEAVDSRVRVIWQVNQGAGAARNTGMEVAKGQYLYFMDSDDYCTPQFLHKVTSFADKYNTDIVVFNYCRFDDLSGEKDYRDGLVKARCPQEKLIFSYQDCPQTICKLVNPTPWNKLYLNDFVKKTNLKWLEITTTNDITFATLSILAAERIAYLDETFLFYRVNAKGSITGLKKYAQDNVIKAVLSVDKQARKFSYYELIQDSIREFIVSNLIGALNSYTPNKNSACYLEFERKIEAIFFSHPLFLNYESYKFHDTKIYENMLEFRRRAMERQDYSFAPKIIVSLTSFPDRIEKVYIALNSIFQQSKKPDKVILWLAEAQFPKREVDLPVDLLDYQRLGLEICWCEGDIRPHKKYFYAMQKYPEDIIITIDDDLTYDFHMIEKLFVSYLHYPNAVSTMRTHLIKGDVQGKLGPYESWVKEYSGLIGIPSMQLFSTSGAGTLFPPHCMDEEVFNMEMIKKLCLNADDLWLKVMQVRKGTPVVLVEKNRLLRYIPDTQHVALRKLNVYQADNDNQLENILGVYDAEGELTKCMLKEAIDEKTTKEHFDFRKSDKYGIFREDAVLVETQKSLEKAQRELEEIRNCTSYRIGRKITYFPGRFKVMLHCYEEYGIKYTICRGRDHFVAFIQKIYCKLVGKKNK